MKPGRTLAASLALVLGLYSSGSRLRAAGQPPTDQVAADISPEALAHKVRETLDRQVPA